MEIKQGKGVRWINIEKPDSKDLAWLQKEFNIHPVILEELRVPSARARVDVHHNYLYFVYYFPLYDTKTQSSVRAEIDFVITKDSVVTVHYLPLKEPLGSFSAEQLESSLKLMHALVQHLMNFEERELRHIREKVEAVGRDIFSEKDREVLQRIMYLKRDVSEYRIAVRLQDPILRSLLTRGKKFWKEDAEIYLNDLLGDQLKITGELEDYREAIGDFERTINQLMNMKINSVMKTFTGLSFLTFPFVLIAALFGMNTKDTPIVNLPGAFWIISGTMAVAMVILIVYFKKKGWF